MKKLLKTTSCAIGVSLIVSFISLADEQTTSALIALYEQSVYVPSQEEMNELTRQLMEYNKLLERNKQIKEYNSAVDDAAAYQQMLAIEIQEQLDIVMKDAYTCSATISEDIYGDINTLIALDSEYKGKIKQADFLMQEVNKYYSVSKLATLDRTIEQRHQELEEMQEELTMPEVQVVDGEFILGDVYRCKSPAAQPYQVTSSWGSRISPVTGTSIEYHNGIDLYAPAGTDVYSVFNGRVLEAGDNWALGNYVRIQHGAGVVSIYGSLSKTTVKAGDYVTQYQKIGEAGSTGNKSTGDHLHFGLFINGQSVDPNVLLKNAKQVGSE